MSAIETINLNVPVSLKDVAEDVAYWDDIAEIVGFISSCVSDAEVAAFVCRELTKVWSLDNEHSAS